MEKGEGMNTKSLLGYLLCVPGVSFLLVQSANATLLASDGFNYTAGTGLSGNDR